MLRVALFRLAAQYFVLLALIIGFLDLIVYATVSSALQSRVDGYLAAAVKRAEGVFTVSGDNVSVSGQVLFDPSVADTYIYAQQLNNSAPIQPAPTTSRIFGNESLGPAILRARQGEVSETRVATEDGLFVVETRPLVDPKRHNKVVGILQVAEPISWVNDAISRLVSQLVWASVIGLILGALASMLMAVRSLRPIIRALDRQRAFVADASHELRTPLTLIRTNVEAWLRRAGGANRAYARNIIDEVEHLNRIVGDLTTLALADARHLRIEYVPIELNDVVRDLMSHAQPLAEERGVTLRPELNGGTRIDADPARLRQLLLILIDNALQHTPAGGKVSIGVAREDGHALIRVSDTGEGIPAADLPHIFERFYRADKARGRDSGGSGLGLAIAKWIVDAHHGEIAVTSEQGKGTEVDVTLPAKA